MTINEMANIAGCHRETVIEAVKRFYPDKICKGKTTRLNQSEAIKIMGLLPKKNMIQPMENSASQLEENSISPNQGLSVIDIQHIITGVVKAVIPTLEKLIDSRMNYQISQTARPFLIENKRDKAAYIGEKVAEQIRAKQERREKAEELELYLFDLRWY